MLLFFVFIFFNSSVSHNCVSQFYLSLFAVKKHSGSEAGKSSTDWTDLCLCSVCRQTSLHIDQLRLLNSYPSVSWWVTASSEASNNPTARPSSIQRLVFTRRKKHRRKDAATRFTLLFYHWCDPIGESHDRKTYKLIQRNQTFFVEILLPFLYFYISWVIYYNFLCAIWIKLNTSVLFITVIS